MAPRLRFPLPHAEPTSLHDLEGRSLAGREEEEQPSVRGREGAVLIHAKPASRPGLPIEAPRRHMRLERHLEGGNQERKLLERQAGQIQALRWAGLHVGASSAGHMGCLLLLET